MSLETAGVWNAGVWVTTVWADDVWREGEPPEIDPVEPGTSPTFLVFPWVWATWKVSE